MIVCRASQRCSPFVSLLPELRATMKRRRNVVFIHAAANAGPDGQLTNASDSQKSFRDSAALFKTEGEGPFSGTQPADLAFLQPEEPSYNEAESSAQASGLTDVIELQSRRRLAGIIPLPTDAGRKSWSPIQQLEFALNTDDLEIAIQRLENVSLPFADVIEESTGGARMAEPDAVPADEGRELLGRPVLATVEGGGETFEGLFQRRAAHILDLALQESDLALVGRAYDWLHAAGVLPSFGREKETILLSHPRIVTPDVLRAASGLTASQLSPKRWGATNQLLPLGVIAAFSALLNNGIDLRPLAIVLVVLGLADSVYLGGAGQAQLLSLWPAYRRRILVHEAGHTLIAYLLGCAVRGVVLDPFTAMDLGIQGQAGTQFWDATLDMELRANQLSGASVDRYSVVLFAGIAAEALVFGEAEGGESDENLFKALVGNLEPAWSPAKMSNQARWAVLQAYSLLRRKRSALDAVVGALQERRPLGDVVLAAERALAATRRHHN